MLRFPQYFWLSGIHAILMLLLPRDFHCLNQITTGFGDDLEKPAFKKCTAFIVKYRVATFENEREVFLFPPYQ